MEHASAGFRQNTSSRSSSTSFRRWRLVEEGWDVSDPASSFYPWSCLVFVSNVFFFFLEVFASSVNVSPNACPLRCPAQVRSLSPNACPLRCPVRLLIRWEKAEGSVMQCESRTPHWMPAACSLTRFFRSVCFSLCVAAFPGHRTRMVTHCES